MKFGYAIVLALVALVAVSGFAAADRLPSQVPENQIFTIDTLIDVTGQVSEESEMQWTLDDMDFQTTTIGLLDGALAAGNGVTLEQIIQQFDNPLTNTYTAANLLTDLTAPTMGVTVRDTFVTGVGSVLDSVSVSQELLGTQINPTAMPGFTYQDLINALDANAAYGTQAVSTNSGSIHNTMLWPTEEIMILTWTDSLRSNGGKLSLSKNIDFNSKDQGKGLSNLEVEKVLTYASTEGNHLVGSEEWTLDVAGSYEQTANTIRCVFATSSSPWFPAFCNVVKAKSELVNINSAQVSTKGAARSVAASGDVPAMLNYMIAVTPDSNSGSGFADGTVKTLFGGSIMEARDNHVQQSATNNWKDTASVSGGIKNFQKTFNYESGFTI